MSTPSTTSSLSIHRVQKTSGNPTVIHVQILLGKDVLMVETTLEGLARSLTGELSVPCKVIRNTFAL